MDIIMESQPAPFAGEKSMIGQRITVALVAAMSLWVGAMLSVGLGPVPRSDVQRSETARAAVETLRTAPSALEPHRPAF